MENQSSNLTLRDLQIGIQDGIYRFHSAGKVPHQILSELETIPVQEGRRVPQVSSDDRFEIYAQAWFLRLEEAVLDDFPVTQALMGEERWLETLKDYFLAHPSRSFSIVDCSPEFVSFVQRSPKFAHEPWIFEMAQVEDRFAQTFYGPDTQIWETSQLAALSPEAAAELPIGLQSGVSFFKVNWDLLSLQAQHEAGQKLEPQKKPQSLMIYRKGYSPSLVQVASDEEFAFLKSCEAAPTLGELAERFADSPSSDHWIAWLTHWASQGVLCPKNDLLRNEP